MCGHCSSRPLCAGAQQVADQLSCGIANGKKAVLRQRSCYFAVAGSEPNEASIAISGFVQANDMMPG